MAGSRSTASSKATEWYERFYTSDRPDDNRNHAQRDRDRIQYTTAFRRLAGVTQVIGAAEGHVVHNRLTHTLEVAQVTRRLAERLSRDQSKVAKKIGGVDPDVGEAAAMAHDLGHPPFGHIAEKELRRLGAPYLSDSFEGNAQSFRIVTKLALRAPFREDLQSVTFPGLNLTRATLAGVLKYPWVRTSGAHENKWGAYQSEERQFKWARELFSLGDDSRSVEAELMNWADDITYSVHDVEDFYRVGIVPLDRLRADNTELNRFFDATFKRAFVLAEGYGQHDLEDAFGELIWSMPVDEPYAGTERQRSNLRTLTAYLIGRYIRATELREPTPSDMSKVSLDPEHRKEVIMLKELIWHYVINRPSLATQQHGQRTVIAGLFDAYMKAAEDEALEIFPPAARDALGKIREDLTTEDRRKQIVRLITDLIASMGEAQAIRLYHRLTAVSLGSALNFRL